MALRLQAESIQYEDSSPNSSGRGNDSNRQQIPNKNESQSRRDNEVKSNLKNFQISSPGTESPIVTTKVNFKLHDDKYQTHTHSPRSFNDTATTSPSPVNLLQGTGIFSYTKDFSFPASDSPSPKQTLSRAIPAPASQTPSFLSKILSQRPPAQTTTSFPKKPSTDSPQKSPTRITPRKDIKDYNNEVLTTASGNVIKPLLPVRNCYRLDGYSKSVKDREKKYLIQKNTKTNLYENRKVLPDLQITNEKGEISLFTEFSVSFTHKEFLFGIQVGQIILTLHMGNQKQNFFGEIAPDISDNQNIFFSPISTLNSKSLSTSLPFPKKGLSIQTLETELFHKELVPELNESHAKMLLYKICVNFKLDGKIVYKFYNPSTKRQSQMTVFTDPKYFWEADKNYLKPTWIRFSHPEDSLINPAEEVFERETISCDRTKPLEKSSLEKNNEEETIYIGEVRVYEGQWEKEADAIVAESPRIVYWEEGKKGRRYRELSVSKALTKECRKLFSFYDDKRRQKLNRAQVSNLFFCLGLIFTPQDLEMKVFPIIDPFFNDSITLKDILYELAWLVYFPDKAHNDSSSSPSQAQFDQSWSALEACLPYNKINTYQLKNLLLKNPTIGLNDELIQEVINDYLERNEQSKGERPMNKSRFYSMDTWYTMLRLYMLVKRGKLFHKRRETV